MNTSLKIEWFDPGTKPADGQPALRRHPLQKFIPEPVKESPEWAAFKVGLSAVGPEGIPPLVITADGQIMDGKRRWLAARELQWTKVPCLIRDEADAALIMMDSLFGQRDLDRGTKAYIAISMQGEYVKSAENRRLGNLKRGTKTLEFPLFSPKHSDCASGGDDLADRIGCHRNVVVAAADIFRLFHDPKCEGWKSFYGDGAQAKMPPLAKLQELQKHYREEYEPLLLTGEKTIWKIRPAIAGALPVHQENNTRQPEQAELKLWDDSLASVGKLAPTWDKLTETNQRDVLATWRRTVKKLPQALRAVLKEVLDETL